MVSLNNFAREKIFLVLSWPVEIKEEQWKHK